MNKFHNDPDDPMKFTLPPIPASEYSKIGAGGREAALHKRDCQERVLNAYARTGKVGTSCRSAKVAYASHKRWLVADPIYRKAFDLIDEMWADELEGVVRELAINGEEKVIGVSENGEPIVTVQRDHNREKTVLKAFKRERYADRYLIENEGLESNMARLSHLFGKMGLVFPSSSILEASYAVLDVPSGGPDSPGGVGRIEAGGPPLEGVAPPSPQKESTGIEKGPISNGNGTPEGPMAETPKE